MDNYDEGSTMEGMYNLMKRVRYTNSYYVSSKWYSEKEIIYKIKNLIVYKIISSVISSLVISTICSLKNITQHRRGTSKNGACSTPRNVSKPAAAPSARRQARSGITPCIISAAFSNIHFASFTCSLTHPIDADVPSLSNSSHSRLDGSPFFLYGTEWKRIFPVICVQYCP